MSGYEGNNRSEVAVGERLDKSISDLRALRARICAIGPATRKEVEKLHLKVDVMPDEYVAEGLAKAFKCHDMTGKRVLLPRAAIARDLLPNELRRLGAQVDVLSAYQTIMPSDAPEHAKQVFARKPDWVLLTSSSTARNLVKAAGVEVLEGVKIASIGPVTSETARSLGMEVAIQAENYTVDGLIEVLLKSA